MLGAYALSRARATRYPVRFTAVSTLRRVAGIEPRWRRRLPAMLALAGLSALPLALSKPHRAVRVPIGGASIMLVTDHSASMGATDVPPTRLAAAERAARAFIDELPTPLPVGVVTYSDKPDSVQAPTSGHGRVSRMIDAQVARGGADTGDALQLAIGLLRRDSPPSSSSAVILLSSGANTTGRDPVEVASQAGKPKIPIYTVTLGSQDATIPNPEGLGLPVPASTDPQLLARIAQASHGQAFTAQDQGHLDSIYERLGWRLGSRARAQELTTAFVVGGLLLLVAAGVTSLHWSGGLP
jgi:Ca-activated chloride channel homolog